MTTTTLVLGLKTLMLMNTPAANTITTWNGTDTNCMQPFKQHSLLFAMHRLNHGGHKESNETVIYGTRVNLGP